MYENEEDGVERRRICGGFKIELLSSLWNDLCTVCIRELIEENINRK